MSHVSRRETTEEDSKELFFSALESTQGRKCVRYADFRRARCVTILRARCSSPNHDRAEANSRASSNSPSAERVHHLFECTAWCACLTRSYRSRPRHGSHPRPVCACALPHVDAAQQCTTSAPLSLPPASRTPLRLEHANRSTGERGRGLHSARGAPPRSRMCSSWGPTTRRWSTWSLAPACTPACSTSPNHAARRSRRPWWPGWWRTGRWVCPGPRSSGRHRP